MKAMTCFTCKHKKAISDGAGKGLYVCRNHPSLVVSKYDKRGKELVVSARQDCWEEEA